MFYKILAKLITPTHKKYTQKARKLISSTPRKTLFTGKNSLPPTESYTTIKSTEIIINNEPITLKIATTTTRYKITNPFQLLHLDLKTITKIIFRLK